MGAKPQTRTSPYSSLWFCSLSCSHFCSLPSMSVPFLLRSLLLFLLPTFHFCTISTPYSTFFAPYLPCHYHLYSLLYSNFCSQFLLPFLLPIFAPNFCSRFLLPIFAPDFCSRFSLQIFAPRQAVTHPIVNTPKPCLTKLIDNL